MAKGFHRVAQVSQVLPGQAKVVRVADREIALCNVGGRFYAIANICTHDGGSLDQGELTGHVIECPRHGAQFNVKTGEVVRAPALVPLKTYEARVQGDDVEVGLEA
ncbi:MAG: non-heme iron oxygenase ferredoxin subunit [Chloroflexi bacterium]|nr:non-heme iron oxygenase ferredoxin subunit [Chloroflexota bacterium]